MIGGSISATLTGWMKIRDSVAFAETLSFSVDPHIRVPRNHVFDFTIQRELPWRLLLEVGYIGRLARDLYVTGNLNSVPIMHRDVKSGQTFAEAFDAVAAQLRNKRAVSPQPYFENLYGSGTTAALANSNAGDFIVGNVSVQLVGNRPKLAPRREEAEAAAREALDILEGLPDVELRSYALHAAADAALAGPRGFAIVADPRRHPGYLPQTMRSGYVRPGELTRLGAWAAPAPKTSASTARDSLEAVRIWSTSFGVELLV